MLVIKVLYNCKKTQKLRREQKFLNTQLYCIFFTTVVIIIKRQKKRDRQGGLVVKAQYSCTVVWLRFMLCPWATYFTLSMPHLLSDKDIKPEVPVLTLTM